MTVAAAGAPERPTLRVVLAGRELAPEAQLDVLEVDVAEEVGRHGHASLLVKNWNPDTRQVRHSDGTLFAPGTDIEIALGWQDGPTGVFDGVITAVTGHFGGPSGPTLQVACRSRSALLAAVPRARTYEGVDDGDVAGDLAARYGLTADAADGQQQPLVSWAGCADWTYLVARAARLGWVTYVRGRELVFRPAARPAGDDPAVEFGTGLIELRVSQDLGGRAGTVATGGWSSEDLAAVSAQAGSDRAEPAPGGRPTPTDAIADSGWPLRAAAEDSAAGLPSDEVDRLAVAAAGREMLRHFHGHGRVLGMPALRSDSWLSVGGVGTRLGGSHYVSAVRHRLGRQGFTTEFQLGLPPPLTPPAPDAPGAAGGLLLGTVTDLDDPLGWGRVKVGFPWLSDAPEALWARLSTLAAGADQGTFFIPDKGQEVLVGFVDHDRRFPVVLGALWNGQQPPPEAVDAERNAIRAIVTRSGHRLSFDDTGPGSVTLLTAAGHTLVLDDDAKTITMAEQGGGASITLGGDGIALKADRGDITLKAAAGAVKIEAAGFETTSTGPAKLESTATLDLKAATSLSVSGVQVRIN